MFPRSKAKPSGYAQMSPRKRVLTKLRRAHLGLCVGFALLAVSQCGQIFNGASIAGMTGNHPEAQQSASQPPVEQSFELAGLNSGIGIDLNVPADPKAVLIGVERAYPFIWPATGGITSYMSNLHPNGIDIGLDNSAVSPIVASAAGTVTFAGGSDLEDYGLHIEVEHGNGLSTLYAHLSRILVSVGQQVGQGQLIGHGGSTGKSDGKHLHFEMHWANSLLDPIKMLPAQGKTQERSTNECGPTPLIVDRGSRTTLNFDSVAGPQETLLSGTLIGLTAGPPALEARVLQRTAIDLLSAPGFGSPKDDTFRLSVRFTDGAGERSFDCDVLLKTRSVTPSFYARIYPASSATATVTRTPATAAVASGTPVAATSTPAPLPPGVKPSPTPPPALQDPSQLEASSLAALLPTVQAALFGPTVTAVPPSPTAVPPTPTSVPPTATAVPPTAVPPTATPVPPTKTPVPPATPTPRP